MYSKIIQKKTVSLKSSVFVASLILTGCSQPQAKDNILDICKYKMTFGDDFNTLSVSSSNNERTRWSAHTPWNGDFGDAKFIDPIDMYADPEKNAPFHVKDGILTIRAQKHEDGKWTSGLLSSADPTNAGFAQAYGYFEARMKLPPGPGVWSAFWLGTNAKKGDKAPSVEIDVIEYYGQFSDGFHSVLHVWNSVDPHKTRSEDIVTKVPSGSLTTDFHNYGVEVSKDFIIYYLDRKEVGRHVTPVEHNRPLMVLVNLALGSGWPIDKTPNPSDLLVDYIHVYSLDETKKDSNCSDN